MIEIEVDPAMSMDPNSFIYIDAVPEESFQHRSRKLFIILSSSPTNQRSRLPVTSKVLFFN
ncbi:hypothetical protein BVC80_949g61 [Macleaya cordata]|uniref:Uncharacterized protein n=1 Tax=Macleaya cordata TaxID=56857 RepID=A0A200QX62_MACCD|nr:hypothetical protein BVC80_949g61 [Macleaya cordata]